jgi:glycosyltransferase involved in cell wall biosynthesis
MSRIAIFLPSLEGGGAERVIVDVANGIAARGHEVDLVLAKAAGPYLVDVAANVRVVDLGARRTAASLVPLIAYLRSRRPEAMLSALHHANVVAILARAISRVPTRLVVSERNAIGADAGRAAPRLERLLFGLMKLLYRRADHVVAVSGGVAADVVARVGVPSDRVSVVYNPVAMSEIAARAEIPTASPWLGPGQPPVILGVGRLTEQKGFDTLIRAFAAVRSTRPCRLVILGEGELRAQLGSLASSLGIENDLSMPGFDSNPYAWMRRSAVFVLSSRWEGLPNALLQAMACGARVVSTRCPSGPDEILENGRWGTLVPVDDARALAGAIGAALDAETSPNVQERVARFDLVSAVDGYLRTLCPALLEAAVR